MTDKTTIGLFFIGMAVGLYFPSFPPPLDIVKPYLGIVFLVIAVALMVKS